MIEKQLMHRIKSEYDLYYIALSGGKDSTATLLWAMENLPKEKIMAIFVDIGNESKITLDYIRYLERSLKLRIIRIMPKESFSEVILKKGFFPSPNVRFCTNLLKIDPANEIIKLLKGKIKKSDKIKNYKQILEIKNSLPENPNILTLTGIRADESKERSKYPLFEENFSLTQTDILRPIINWKVDDVFSYIKKKGLDPNPLYKLGCSRVGCFPCIFAKGNEVKLLFENPEFDYDKQKILNLEAKIGRKFFINKSLEEKYLHIKKNQTEFQKKLFELKSENNTNGKDICNVNGISFCE